MPLGKVYVLATQEFRGRDRISSCGDGGARRGSGKGGVGVEVTRLPSATNVGVEQTSSSRKYSRNGRCN